jgi:hypothetical protein
MSKTGGTQVNVGIGIEATPGTAVGATHYPKWAELSMQAVAEKELLTSAFGVRNQSSDSMIRRRYSRGSLSVIPNGDIIAPLYYLALGGKNTGSATDGTYPHTLTVQNANASMKTFTMLVEDGGIVTERYANCVIDQTELTVSDSYARFTAQILGGFPDTGTVTEAYTKENEYAYHQLGVKFGTSLSNAASQSATPLKSFSLRTNNNVQLDEAFLSGSNTPAAGGFVAGRFQAGGSYSLHFADTTELNKYKANTKSACIATFTGPVIGSGAVLETTTINLGRLVLTGEPKEYNLDGLLVLNQQFEVEFDATDKEVSVVVVNDTASYA